MGFLGFSRNGRRSEERLATKALEMAQNAVYGVEDTPTAHDVVERAEEYLKFIRTGKALPPL